MDVEQRARELLAAEYNDDPMMQQKVMAGTCRNEELVRAERAIIAALTPPEGYVLVQVDQDSVDFYVCDACGHHYMQDGVNCDCIPSSTARPLRHVRMLAARPEGKP
ncbi:hypothetical protein JAK47_01905 [Stenotrophomonas maltophilia]|uniref:hypothetical protein n=1 Tax=Stenotrophomonas maltophilia TaxID=40324 RepID=UPI0021CA5B4F|nr:hypothetical protein [Stenotrophomonas maltophilia]MCU1053300.1 hypothetical protein [Stenotrophomonas maltophilia]